jgi:hypothetical protein
MKKYLNILLIVALLTGAVSCNEDEVFEKEQYKVAFALVSEDDHNIFNVLHDLDAAESTGYVAASCGGSNPSETDIRISLKQDSEPFDKYNTDNFDMNTAKYAQRLSSAHFSIDNYGITVPRGERGGRMAIKIRPDGLSPDSVYFIPLKVDSYSTYEVNPVKSDVLYRVRIKNKYATQPSVSDYTTYTLRAVKNGGNMMTSKAMHPISSNQVRIMAGTDPFEQNVELINRQCIILTVDADNQVSISPFKSIDVRQIDSDDPDYDPNYPNVFQIEDTGYRLYKMFLLQYEYTIGNETFRMKEELRIQLTDDEKAKFNL